MHTTGADTSGAVRLIESQLQGDSLLVQWPEGEVRNLYREMIVKAVRLRRRVEHVSREVRKRMGEEAV